MSQTLSKSLHGVNAHVEEHGGYNKPGLGVKADQGKLQWNLLPLETLHGTVQVLMFGLRKYAPWNWRRGMPYSQAYNALLRHLDAWNAGEDLDPESGLSHLDHAMCDLVFLRTFTLEHPELDDRYANSTPKENPDLKAP